MALQLKPIIAAKAKETQGTRTDLTSVTNVTNVDTKRELAKIAGVSHNTISKVESKLFVNLMPNNVRIFS